MGSTEVGISGFWMEAGMKGVVQKLEWVGSSILVWMDSTF